MAHALVASLALCASGCAYTVRLLSAPTGAVVLLPDGAETTTPTEARFVRGERQLVRVEATGYLPLVVDMNRTEGRLLRYIGGVLFQKGGREVTFVLIEEHGPVGTAP